jgi:hypothetical protein
LQRIAYRVMHSQYCDTVLAEYQQVVENLEEELRLTNKQIVIQDTRYENLNYIFSNCAAERQALTKENTKLKQKVKRTRIIAISATGIAIVGWLIALL